MSSSFPAATSCSGRRALRDGLAKHLARVHERGGENAARYRDVPLEPVLRIHDGDMELLDRKILETWREEAHDVAREADGCAILSDFGGKAPAKLESSVYGDRASDADAVGRRERRDGMHCDATQRSTGPAQDLLRNLERGLIRRPRTEEDGEQLRGAQCGGTE